MTRLLFLALAAPLTVALGSCVDTSCYGQCDLQRSDCLEEFDGGGEQVACESSYEDCTSRCLP